MKPKQLKPTLTPLPCPFCGKRPKAGGCFDPIGCSGEDDGSGASWIFSPSDLDRLIALVRAEALGEAERQVDQATDKASALMRIRVLKDRP